MCNLGDDPGIQMEARIAERLVWGGPFQVIPVVEDPPDPQVNGVIMEALHSNKVSSNQGSPALGTAGSGMNSCSGQGAIRSRVLALRRKG